MYAIRPLGVAFPRHADDVAAAVRRPRDARRPGPRPRRRHQPGRADRRPRAGARLVPAHATGSIELDPEARTARVQPWASCRTSSTGAAAPHGLMFGPDTSTSNRATIGGMIGNNSAGSGSRALRHDHRPRPHARRRARPTARRARFEPVDEAERARRAGADTLEGRALPRAARARRRATRASIARRLPAASGGGPAATGSTGWPTRRPPFDLAKFVVGVGGHAGRRHRGDWSTWCPSRGTRSSPSGTSTSVAGRHRRDRGRAVAATRRRSS